jgi:hypothetical protein
MHLQQRRQADREMQAVNAPTAGAVPLQEQPVFGLGILGFGPEERNSLESALGACPARPGWRICAFAEADAWCVNGARVRVMPDGNLRVAAGLPTEKALRLDLQDVDRPIAFATPLPADFEPQWHFNLGSPASIEAVLLQFDKWLWQARAQFVLGARIVKAAERGLSGVYHVSHEARLLAVLDFEQGRAAFLPRAHPVALAESRWIRRPSGAHDLPEHFVRSTPAELVWTYARHTERDMLPARYRQRTIYYRRVPRVPLRMLRDSQLLILGELSSSGGVSLDELERRTALPRARLERDVACLYYANAITTEQRNAAVAGQGFKGAPSTGSMSELDPALLWDESFPPPVAAAPTTPVMLGRRADTTTRPTF